MNMVESTRSRSRRTTGSIAAFQTAEKFLPAQGWRKIQPGALTFVYETMRTANLMLIFVTLMLWGCSIAQHSPGTAKLEPVRYRNEVNETNAGGKNLVMTFEELRRDEKTSTVKVTFRSGASVPSIMFIVRGFYDIANARHALYFANLKEWKAEDGGWMYLAGFSNDKTVDPYQYFGLPVSLPKLDAHNFMAVKDCDLLFKAQP